MRARRSLKAEISTVFTPLTASKVGSRLTSIRNDFHTSGPDIHPIRPLYYFKDRIPPVKRGYRHVGIPQIPDDENRTAQDLAKGLVKITNKMGEQGGRPAPPLGYLSSRSN
jgi:hypothetical protein